MKTNDLIKYLRRFPVAIIGGIIIVGCLAGFFLRGDVLTDLKTREDELSSRLKKVEINQKNAVGIEQDVEAVRALADQIESRLFEREEKAVNNEFFYGFEDAGNILISAVTQLPGTDAVFGEDGPKALDEHDVIPFRLEVRGGFNETLQLLYELHVAKPFIRVSGFEIRRETKSAEDALSCVFNLSILAEKEE